jgi:hypothetical protein
MGNPTPAKPEDVVITLVTGLNTLRDMCIRTPDEPSGSLLVHWEKDGFVSTLLYSLAVKFLNEHGIETEDEVFTVGERRAQLEEEERQLSAPHPELVAVVRKEGDHVEVRVFSGEGETRGFCGSLSFPFKDWDETHQFVFDEVVDEDHRT